MILYIIPGHIREQSKPYCTPGSENGHPEQWLPGGRVGGTGLGPGGEQDTVCVPVHLACWTAGTCALCLLH